MRVEAKRHTNRKMDKSTYELRRKVIDLIYEAKKLVPSLPRIEVRITDCTDLDVLGTARMNCNMIWIPAKTVLESNKTYLKQVVFHELLHAAYGIEHQKGCPLMNSVIFSSNEKTINRLFLKYATT